jgi:hypothetical protein
MVAAVFIVYISTDGRKKREANVSKHCDRTSLVRPGSSPACETNNKNVGGIRVQLAHPTTQKDRKPSDLGKPVV